MAVRAISSMRESVVCGATARTGTASDRTGRTNPLISPRRALPYSTLGLSRNCSTTALSSKPDLVSSTSLALAQRVLASRLSSCARGSRRRPPRRRRRWGCSPAQRAPPADRGLLTHVGFGREPGSPPGASGRDRSGPIARAAWATCSASRARIASTAPARCNFGAMARALRFPPIAVSVRAPARRFAFGASRKARRPLSAKPAMRRRLGDCDAHLHSLRDRRLPSRLKRQKAIQRRRCRVEVRRSKLAERRQKRRRARRR